MKFLTPLFLCTLMSFQVWGSAEVCIDHKSNEVQIKAHYYFYGDQAFYAQAGPCVAEINRMFNNGTVIQLNKQGPWRKVNTKVTYSIVSEKDARHLADENINPKINFGRIDTPMQAKDVVISEHALKGNYGYFLVKNGLGTSTTCAHEFAHGLGLKHIDENCDWRGKGVPPIMAPRGCKVDKKYQYDPTAQAGSEGGTVNPIHRRIHHTELAKLNLGDLPYRWVSQEKECAKLGKASNKIYKKDGSFFESLPFFSW